MTDVRRTKLGSRTIPATHYRPPQSRIRRPLNSKLQVLSSSESNYHSGLKIIRLAGMLNRLINHNDQIPLTSTSLTRFHSRSPPTISIKDYLKRIYRYTNPERICLILILNYIDRICKNLTNFTICSLTVHRFCITSVTVGSKFICDSFYSNARYAKVGGISLTEINLLEREFLLAIDYRLLASNEELNKYYSSLVESHPLYTTQKQSRTLSGIAPVAIKEIDPSSKVVELGESDEKKGEARVTECRRSCDDPQPKQASSVIESHQRDPKRMRSKDQSAPSIQDRSSSTRAEPSPIDRDPPIDSPPTQHAPLSHVSPDCFVED